MQNAVPDTRIVGTHTLVVLVMNSGLHYLCPFLSQKHTTSVTVSACEQQKSEENVTNTTGKTQRRTEALFAFSECFSTTPMEKLHIFRIFVFFRTYEKGELNVNER
jgi:hypothetical protein